jgi:hypothetical protein
MALRYVERFARQSLVGLLQRAVTFARTVFELAAIQHHDPAAVATDRAGVLQPQRRDRDAFAAHTEEAGRRLVRQHLLVRLHPVHAEQQAPAQLLIDRVIAVADRGLSDLRIHGIHKWPNDFEHRAGATDLILHNRSAYSLPLPATLDPCLNGLSTATHERQQAHDTLVSDDRDLTGLAVAHHAQQRHDRGHRAIDVRGLSH